MSDMALGIAAVLSLLLAAGCDSQTAGDGAEDGGAADTDGDTDTDTDSETETETESDSETDTWPVFDSDCYTETVNGLEIPWCRVSGGSFRMGCDAGRYRQGDDWRCPEDAQPPHEVVLSPYEMMQTEVSTGMYRACIEDGACDDPAHYVGYDEVNTPQCNMDRAATYDFPFGFDEHPMNCVDWHGAKAFCEWIGAALPTEAQWEHAAAGEHDGMNGDDWLLPFHPLVPQDTGGWWGCTHANYFDFGTGVCFLYDTVPVGSLEATSWGLHDSAGNVAEWCHDWYAGEYYYASESYGPDPTGPYAGERRLIRGGAWYTWHSQDYPNYKSILVSLRESFPPALSDCFDLNGVYYFSYFGIRCARQSE